MHNANCNLEKINLNVQCKLRNYAICALYEQMPSFVEITMSLFKVSNN